MVVGGLGWLWMVFSWFWAVVGGLDWLRWFGWGGCGWFWLVFAGFGWLWVVVGGCGWFWLVPRFSTYAFYRPKIFGLSKTWGAANKCLVEHAGLQPKIRHIGRHSKTVLFYTLYVICKDFIYAFKKILLQRFLYDFLFS